MQSMKTKRKIFNTKLNLIIGQLVILRDSDFPIIAQCNALPLKLF